MSEITSECEEAFYDLVFQIREHTKLADGGQTIRTYGTHGGTEIGFAVSLSSAWRKNTFGPDDVVYGGKVIYRSIGPESDLFLRVLDELYATEQSPTHMKTETAFSGISLQGDPRDLDKGIVKIKLFFQDNDPDSYAELYTHIDLKGRKLYVNEKDMDYRLAVVRALRAS